MARLAVHTLSTSSVVALVVKCLQYNIIINNRDSNFVHRVDAMD